MTDEPRGDLIPHVPALVGEVECTHGISNGEVITTTWCDIHPSCMWFDCTVCGLDKHIPVYFGPSSFDYQPQTIVSRAKELE